MEDRLVQGKVKLDDKCLNLDGPYPSGTLLTFDFTPPASFHDIQVHHIPTNSAQPSQGDRWRWRNPAQFPSRIENLRLRHRILRAVRDYFNSQDFLEVQTPVRVKVPNPEHHFRPIGSESGWLSTSPEFQMKRLLVGGLERIYQITPCFRGKESGTLHNPEFHMLEWYRAWERLEDVVEDMQQVVFQSAQTSPNMEGGKLVYGENRIDLTPPWPQHSVNECFKQHLGLNLGDLLNGPLLKQAAMEQGFGRELQDYDDGFEAVFHRLWNLIEPRLGLRQPLIVYDWPAQQASLAQLRSDDPRWAERAELYIAGMELANGFGELTDPNQQRKRFEQENEIRLSLGLETFALDEAFLCSLQEGMPPSAGMALGVERLVMLLGNLTDIRQAMCFADDEI